MKTTYKMTMPLMIGALLASAGVTQAALTAVSEDFSSAGSVSSWSSVGATTTIVSHNTVLSDIGAVNNGDLFTDVAGDGVGDGQLNMNVQNAVQGDEAILFTMGGTMSIGESISLEAIAGARGNSFTNLRFEIINITDGNTVLASTANTLSRPLPDPLPDPVSGVGDTATADVQGMQTFSLNYTGLASDDGDVIGIRLVENANHAARDLLIDNLTVAVPEPSFTALLGLGGLALLMHRRR